MQKSFTLLENSVIKKFFHREQGKVNSLTGFTLVEILIGLTMFLFLLLALQSFIGSIFSSSFKALAMKRLADGTRTSLEIMGREIRLAAVSNGAAPAPCNTIAANRSFDYSLGNNQLRFINFEGDCITYTFTAPVPPALGRIEKTINNESAELFLGGSTLNVENATFTLNPPAWSATQQDRVIINIKVSTKDPTSPTQELEIDLQTTVSQREI